MFIIDKITFRILNIATIKKEEAVMFFLFLSPLLLVLPLQIPKDFIGWFQFSAH